MCASKKKIPGNHHKFILWEMDIPMKILNKIIGPVIRNGGTNYIMMGNANALKLRQR